LKQSDKAIKQQNLKRKIDELVYKLYNLTNEEVNVVENSLSK
jgi:hypothetical protein